MKVNLQKYSQNSIMNIREAFRSDDFDFSVDWLNVRLDCDSVDVLLCRILKFLPELDMSDFAVRESGGVCFYKNGLHIPYCGHSSFVIAYNLDENGQLINKKSGRGQLYGILLSISGDGCRFIDSLHNGALLDLLEAISIFKPICTRIDMACDIFDEENCLVPMIHCFSETAYNRSEASYDLNCNLTRKNPDGTYRQWVNCNLVFDNKLNDFTKNVTVGGRDSSKGTLQLYNKRVEIESGRLSEISEATLNSVGNPDYWWRLEYRCKSFAQKVFLQLLETKNIYAAFIQAASDFGSFVVNNNEVITRCDTAVEWASFLCFVESLCSNPIHLVQLASHEYIQPDLDRNRKFFMDNVGGSFALVILQILLDKKFRRKLLINSLQCLLYNKRYHPALKELQHTYGLKLRDFSEAKEWMQDYFDLGA